MKSANQKTRTIACIVAAFFLAASSTLPSGLMQKAYAQMPGTPGGGAQGPIDITADEQEFAGDSVIARGRVRVVYKDSVILAPLATLYKDPTGNPNRAVFTGHPRLTQGRNKIDANTLVFEMAVNKIIADGNAHSEVDVPEDEQNASDLQAAPVASKAVKAQDPDSEDEDDLQEKQPAKVAEKLAEKSKADKSEKKTGKAEKIITDSERQEYDQASGKFDASGHVKVVHGDIVVFADKLQLVYGALNNKPETALFTGHVIATQGKNTTCADTMNYSLSTKRLQATGHVKSKVIQEKKEGSPKPKPAASEVDEEAKADFLGIAPAIASNNKGLSGRSSATAANSSIATAGAPGDKPVWVYSDAQDYSKDTGRVSAHGNVRVVCGEMFGSGPSIVLSKKADGRADKIFFIGRSQISQPGRKWIADEITYVVDEHRVIANGNAKAMILQNSNDKAPGSKLLPVQPQTRPGDGSRIAERQPAGNEKKKSISASKVEAPK